MSDFLFPPPRAPRLSCGSISVSACWICRRIVSEAQVGADEVLSPCKCERVHRRCLDEWRATGQGDAFTTCPHCRQLYLMVLGQEPCLSDDGYFWLLVAGDCALLAWVLAVGWCLSVVVAAHIQHPPVAWSAAAGTWGPVVGLLGGTSAIGVVALLGVCAVNWCSTARHADPRPFSHKAVSVSARPLAVAGGSDRREKTRLLLIFLLLVASLVFFCAAFFFVAQQAIARHASIVVCRRRAKLCRVLHLADAGVDAC